MCSLRAVFVLVFLFASAALGSPTPQNRIQKRSFTHRVRRSVNTYGASAGASAMTKAYRKYGFQLGRVSAVSDAAATTGETGQVPAVPLNNGASYIEPISIGGQMFNMVFDTGSSDLCVSLLRLNYQKDAANICQVGFLKPSFTASYWPAYCIQYRK
jgi:hypothetical protein